MNRMTWRLAAAAATLVAVPTATAAGYETAAKPNQLHINVVSSPAQYVSGGDARVEIAVPDATALGDVEVTLNGSDVTSAFAPDSEGNHQLEGLVTGLPLGPSTLAASTHKQAKGNKHYDEVTLTNNPLQGPIFSGPHQTPFLCASTGNSAGMGLPPIPQSATCETPTVVSFVYRSTAAGNPFLPYDPAAPPSPASIEMTTTMDGKIVPMILRWERGVINRFMYSILMLSPASQTATPDLSAWNRKALYSFSGGVAIGHTQGAASGGDARVEIAVPDATALGDVEVTLNGTNVTSAFGQDPEGNHQLEGVVNGLPLGPSTLAASTHKTSKGNKYYDEVTLTNTF